MLQQVCKWEILFRTLLKSIHFVCTLKVIRLEILFEFSTSPQNQFVFFSHAIACHASFAQAIELFASLIYQFFHRCCRRCFFF